MDKTDEPPADCYTCELLDTPGRPEHEHTFAELAAAEALERHRRPLRSRALWDMVNRAQAARQKPPAPMDDGLPDGMVLDPAAIAAIYPPDGNLVRFHLWGAAEASVVMAESPAHAVDVHACLVTSKQRWSTLARDSPGPRASGSGRRVRRVRAEARARAYLVQVGASTGETDGARARIVVDAIISDLDGRSGLGFDSVDSETMDEIRATWERLVKQ